MSPGFTTVAPSYDPVSAFGGGSEAFAGSAAVNQANLGIVPPENANQGDPNLPTVLGNGSPVGVVLPTAIGEAYLDQQSDHIWEATGLSNTAWIQRK